MEYCERATEECSCCSCQNGTLATWDHYNAAGEWIGCYCDKCSGNKN